MKNLILFITLLLSHQSLASAGSLIPAHFACDSFDSGRFEIINTGVEELGLGNIHSELTALSPLRYEATEISLVEVIADLDLIQFTYELKVGKEVFDLHLSKYLGYYRGGVIEGDFVYRFNCHEI